ncbi:MAG: stage III sporulation protein AD [Oscillibacter sp.]|nr:stage III sporulation protein AD [Oscillibacter sp.]
MELSIQAAVLCVAAALLALVVRRGSPECALLLTLAAAAVVLLSLAESLETLVEFLGRLVEESGLSRELFIPLYKTVGIALVVKIGGNLCRDAGESALSSVVETAGAVCALLAALPLLRAVLALLLELMR